MSDLLQAAIKTRDLWASRATTGLAPESQTRETFAELASAIHKEQREQREAKIADMRVHLRGLESCLDVLSTRDREEMDSIIKDANGLLDHVQNEWS
jgi:hypothetical protein